MAIGTITMILANVGLSIFNKWAGSRQNKQIAEKREEFERAAREGQRERMLQLMREGQQLSNWKNRSIRNAFQNSTTSLTTSSRNWLILPPSSIGHLRLFLL